MSADDPDTVEDDRTAAMAMLRRAGLSPRPSELAAVLASYAGFQALTASLYGVAEARYEEPAIMFTAEAGAGDAELPGD